MALITGTPLGNVDDQEALFLEGAPNVWIQNQAATPLHNPDSDGFYWGLSGTTADPVTALGCYDGLVMTENLTINDVVCDTVGVKQTIIRRNYVEFQMNLSSLFPLASIRDFLKLGPVTAGAGYEIAGFGAVDQTRFFHLYAAKVYDETNADWVALHFHKCQAVDAFSLAFRYGNQWQLTGIRVRAYPVDTMPAAQIFGVMYRRDPSALP